MKIGITGRLIASHAGIALLVMVVFAVVVISTTSRQATRTGLDVDRATALRLAPWIEEYYRNERSWDRAEPLFLPPHGPAANSRPMSPMMGGRRGGPIPSPFLDQPIMIVAGNGTILFKRDIPDSEAAKIFESINPRNGVPIELPGEADVYLFVGGMVAAEHNPLPIVFIRSTIRAAAVAGIALFVSVSLISVFWVRWLLLPIHNLHKATREIATGNYTVRASVPRGRHELADLVTHFNAMAAEVEAQEQSRKRFVGDAAHELRTPISLLTTRIQMLKAGIYRTNEEQWTALSHDVERLGHLVDELQTLARADAGKLSLSLQPWSVGEAVQAACMQMAPAADDRQITLRQEVAQDAASAYIVVDPQRFRQMMSNLIGNALRFSSPGDELLIEAGLAAGDDARVVEIAVEDSGPGIRREDRSRIFQRFVRLDDDRNRASGGSGLGLAITSELVHMHGGSIRVEAARDNATGARFVISIPLAENVH